jgi:hypothetical protein
MSVTINKIITTPDIIPIVMSRFNRSLETKRLHTGQLAAFHETLAPQQRQRKILRFITFVTSIHSIYQM